MWKLLFMSGVCFSGFAQPANPSQHELLWEISGNGLQKKSYIFGSFHSNDRRVFRLSDSTYYALNHVEAIALETDVFRLFSTWDTRQDVVELTFDKEGNPYTNSKRSSSTFYGDEDGMPQFLDAYFQQYCYNSDKAFYGLETVSPQLYVFPDIQTSDLSETNLRSMLVSKEDILETYLEGDIYQVDALLRTVLSTSDGLYEQLIVDRNFSMADRLDSILQTKISVFCTVGAGHLAGVKGMLNLLRSKGYTVRRVVATFGELGIDELEVRSKKTYIYSNDSLGFYAEFPGLPVAVTDDFDARILKLIYRDLGQGNTYCIEVHELNDESSLRNLANIHIASPPLSPYTKITLENGGEAYEGISDAYPEGVYWTRVLIGPDYFLVLKAYGGNKFMNSLRAQHFFDKLWLE